MPPGPSGRERNDRPSGRERNDRPSGRERNDRPSGRSRDAGTAPGPPAFEGYLRRSPVTPAPAVPRVTHARPAVRSHRVDGVLGALADPTRRRVLDHLSARGPLTATQLACDEPISRQAVVKHLATLAGAGLVAGERHGKEVRYSVRAEALDDLAGWLVEVGAAWDRRLASLRRRFDNDA